jgi:aspartyl-tRNA(Asn)/glutamyl-tRNA(Gln) amidotransferase subunit B
MPQEKPNYQPVIGLEIHIQLKTQSKMFSPTPNQTWQVPPNTNVGPVELGLPGALPTPNEQAIKFTQQFGHALNCSLAKFSKFDRKNYFYPDLPKGYQISQFDQPFCFDGFLEIKDTNDQSKKKKIRIRRIHLEEDTGKSMHKNGRTYLDYNKAGVPLLELVTEPDFANADECSEFAKMVQSAARIINISDADMEKGHLRLEANVSVRRAGQSELPSYRIELKNINSFKFMRDAINYEIKRQIAALEEGETLSQETRGWNHIKGVSVLQRSKEDAHDYRYFPEPDIPPFEFSDEYIESVIANLPKMPWRLEAELINTGVRADYANLLAYDQHKYQKFAQLAKNKASEVEILAKVIANTPDLDQVEMKIKEIVEKREGTTQLGLAELEPIIKQVVTENPGPVAEYRGGKETVIKFLLGQVMQKTKGQADPQLVSKMLVEEIKK